MDSYGSRLEGGTNWSQKVKLHLGNDISRVRTQLPVDVPVRHSTSGYGAIESGIPNWPSHDNLALRAAPSVNTQPDSWPPRALCSGRRTSLETEEDTGRLLIDGIIELNRFNALALRHRVNAILTDAVKTIEIDLSQTISVDSYGLGALIAFRNMMGRRSGAVRLVNPSRLVQQVLELTRLHRVFDIVKCEEGLAE
jgi:anti-sigma B factor antagonist